MLQYSHKSGHSIPSSRPTAPFFLRIGKHNAILPSKTSSSQTSSSTNPRSTPGNNLSLNCDSGSRPRYANPTMEYRNPQTCPRQCSQPLHHLQSQSTSSLTPRSHENGYPPPLPQSLCKRRR